LIDRAQIESISSTNSAIFSKFFEFEIKTPTKECHQIIYYLYAVLKGGDYFEDLNFTWSKAIDMMSKSKRLTDECHNFKIENLQQWKIDLI